MPDIKSGLLALVAFAAVNGAAAYMGSFSAAPDNGLVRCDAGQRTASFRYASGNTQAIALSRDGTAFIASYDKANKAWRNPDRTVMVTRDGLVFEFGGTGTDLTATVPGRDAVKLLAGFRKICAASLS